MQVAVDLSQTVRYTSLLGNVIGSDHQRAAGTTWKPRIVAPTPRSYYTANQAFGYAFGYANPSDDGSDVGNNDAPFKTAILHGEYDYVTKTFTWSDTNKNQNLPSSFYLASKPAWFGALPWPAFGPDPQAPTTALTGKNPARHCYEQGQMPSCLN
jgi:hypothetical protein